MKLCVKQLKYGMLGSLPGLVMVPFLFWCSGFDFDVRGDIAVVCASLTLIATTFGAAMAASFVD